MGLNVKYGEIKIKHMLCSSHEKTHEKDHVCFQSCIVQSYFIPIEIATLKESFVLCQKINSKKQFPKMHGSRNPAKDSWEIDCSLLCVFLHTVRFFFCFFFTGQVSREKK